MQLPSLFAHAQLQLQPDESIPARIAHKAQTSSTPCVGAIKLVVLTESAAQAAF